MLEELKATELGENEADKPNFDDNGLLNDPGFGLKILGPSILLGINPLLARNGDALYACL